MIKHAIFEKKNVLIDRKILATLVKESPETFKKVVEFSTAPEIKATKPAKSAPKLETATA